MKVQVSASRSVLLVAMLVAQVGLQLPAFSADETTSTAQTGKPGPGASGSSRGYIKSQTFAGSVFSKDNNTWVYTKEFADTFDMPEQFIEDVQGVEAAAFRIESLPHQMCGWGGKEMACLPAYRCVVDLHFDEQRTPLPWATNSNAEWLPINSSLRWLDGVDLNRAGYGPIPHGVLPNKTLRGGVIAFADPGTKQQAIFTTNATTQTGDEENVSWSLMITGFTRSYFRSLSVVSLGIPCLGPDRPVVNIRLDAKKSGAYEPPIARFNRISLPRNFVARIREEISRVSERNSAFYRDVLNFPQRGPSASALSRDSIQK